MTKGNAIKRISKFGVSYVDLKSKIHTIKCIRESFGFDRRFTTKDLLEEFQKNTFYSPISRNGLHSRLVTLSNVGYLKVKTTKVPKERGKPAKYYTLTEEAYTRFKRWRDGKRK